jgi:hypothetical protein
MEGEGVGKRIHTAVKSLNGLTQRLRWLQHNGEIRKVIAPCPYKGASSLLYNRFRMVEGFPAFPKRNNVEDWGQIEGHATGTDCCFCHFGARLKARLKLRFTRHNIAGNRSLAMRIKAKDKNHLRKGFKELA